MDREEWTGEARASEGRETRLPSSDAGVEVAAAGDRDYTRAFAKEILPRERNGSVATEGAPCQIDQV
jgi:hypothetical protein